MRTKTDLGVKIDSILGQGIYFKTLFYTNKFVGNFFEVATINIFKFGALTNICLLDIIFIIHFYI